MAAFTANEYFLGRIPDITTIVPGFNVDMAVNAAMSLYWDRFFPNANPLPDICDDVLTERQKVLVALRAVVAILPVAQQLLKPKVTKALAGPAETRFEDRFKLYKLMFDLWQDELTKLEQSEGIVFSTLPNIPAFRLAIHSESVFPSSGYILDRGVVFVNMEG